MREHRRELHPDARQIVDVEEGPVVDLILGHAKESDPPELLGIQPVHFAPVPVERGDSHVDFAARLRVAQREFRQFGLEARRPFGNLRPPVRQVEKPIRQSVERLAIVTEDHWIGEWGDRQLVDAISPNGEGFRRRRSEARVGRASAPRRIRAEHGPEKLPPPSPQSMSNQPAKCDSGPHSSTSSQDGCPPPRPMWFGTMSRMTPRPSRWNASIISEYSASEPSSGFSRRDR